MAGLLRAANDFLSPAISAWLAGMHAGMTSGSEASERNIWSLGCLAADSVTAENPSNIVLLRNARFVAEGGASRLDDAYSVGFACGGMYVVSTEPPERHAETIEKMGSAYASAGFDDERFSEVLSAAASPHASSFAAAALYLDEAATGRSAEFARVDAAIFRAASLFVVMNACSMCASLLDASDGAAARSIRDEPSLSAALDFSERSFVPRLFESGLREAGFSARDFLADPKLRTAVGDAAKLAADGVAKTVSARLEKEFESKSRAAASRGRPLTESERRTLSAEPALALFLKGDVVGSMAVAAAVDPGDERLAQMLEKRGYTPERLVKERIIGSFHTSFAESLPARFAAVALGGEVAMGEFFAERFGEGRTGHSEQRRFVDQPI